MNKKKMLKAKARKNRDKYNIVVYTPVIECVENGKLVWRDSLLVDYLHKEDAILTAKNEIELILLQTN